VALMVYTISLKQTCRGCGRNAVVEVFGQRNQSFGVFCKPCADRRVKAIGADERKASVARDTCPDCGLFGGHAAGCARLLVVECEEPGHPFGPHFHGQDDAETA
jgi:hypothetical protein